MNKTKEQTGFHRNMYNYDNQPGMTIHFLESVQIGFVSPD